MGGFLLFAVHFIETFGHDGPGSPINVSVKAWSFIGREAHEILLFITERTRTVSDPE